MFLKAYIIKSLHNSHKTFLEFYKAEKQFQLLIRSGAPYYY